MPPPAGTAIGNAVFGNHCSFDVYLWSIDEVNQNIPRVKVPAHSTHSEPFHTPCPDETCGIVLQFSRDQQLIGGVGGNHVQFKYTIKNSHMYYDISFADCAKTVTHHGADTPNCPGHTPGSLKIMSSESRCEVLYCQHDTFCKYNRYCVPKPDGQWGIPQPVKGCPKDVIGMDVNFRLCSDQ